MMPTRGYEGRFINEQFTAIRPTDRKGQKKTKAAQVQSPEPSVHLVTLLGCYSPG